MRDDTGGEPGALGAGAVTGTILINFFVAPNGVALRGHARARSHWLKPISRLPTIVLDRQLGIGCGLGWSAP
jgi:hypothetical protein